MARKRSSSYYTVEATYGPKTLMPCGGKTSGWRKWPPTREPDLGPRLQPSEVEYAAVKICFSHSNKLILLSYGRASDDHLLVIQHKIYYSRSYQAKKLRPRAGCAQHFPMHYPFPHSSWCTATPFKRW